MVCSRVTELLGDELILLFATEEAPIYACLVALAVEVEVLQTRLAGLDYRSGYFVRRVATCSATRPV